MRTSESTCLASAHTQKHSQACSQACVRVGVWSQLPGRDGQPAFGLRACPAPQLCAAAVLQPWAGALLSTITVVCRHCIHGKPSDFGGANERTCLASVPLPRNLDPL